MSKGALALALTLPAPAEARELALAQGTIAIQPAAAGLAAPGCEQLFVEARDALDNRLIARTQGALDREGTCRYAISVPAQSAVWLRVSPVLVASVRSDAAIAAGGGAAPARDDRHVSTRAVQLRFTVISPNTYFFAPGEQKTIPLSY